MTDEDLTRAARRYRHAHSELDMARSALVEEIREAHGAGMRQVDIVKATGWTREQIRRVCRAE